MCSDRPRCSMRRRKRRTWTSSAFLPGWRSGQPARREGIPAHDCTEPTDQLLQEPALDGRDRHPASAEAKQPVGVDRGDRGPVSLDAPLEAEDPSPHVGVTHREPDPVLPRIGADRGWGILVDEQEPGTVIRPQELPALPFRRPAEQYDVHLVGDGTEPRFRDCFADVNVVAQLRTELPAETTGIPSPEPTVRWGVGLGRNFRLRRRVSRRLNRRFDGAWAWGGTSG